MAWQYLCAGDRATGSRIKFTVKILQVPTWAVQLFICLETGRM